MKPTKYMGITEVAEYTGYSVAYVYDMWKTWRAEAVVNGQKFGVLKMGGRKGGKNGRVRFVRLDIINFFKSKEMCA